MTSTLDPKPSATGPRASVGSTLIRQLTPDQLDAIRKFDTCTISNAIERFQARLRNEGYTWPGLKCVTGAFPPMLGYAATCRVKSENPPATGHSYYDRIDWWDAIEQVATPRVAVIQDIDSHPGLGACVGEAHASILRALHAWVS
jgi:4-hydroxy-4-methyl-2-oxoglutarate aldolase